MLISDPTKGRHRTPQTRTKATARHALSPVRTRRPLKPTPHRAASPFRTYAATAAALAPKALMRIGGGSVGRE